MAKTPVFSMREGRVGTDPDKSYPLFTEKELAVIGGRNYLSGNTAQLREHVAFHERRRKNDGLENEEDTILHLHSPEKSDFDQIFDYGIKYKLIKHLDTERQVLRLKRQQLEMLKEQQTKENNLEMLRILWEFIKPEEPIHIYKNYTYTTKLGLP